ncbi:cytochrome P450 4g15-like isoform X1 [Eurosta solidaginis]|uniref:cytochrome P450 4g15-like isoform X1 n=1 Tax=Eurosta solidaginis TaxID=178769 RepID=UPI0035308707
MSEATVEILLGAKWRVYRKLIAPTFDLNVLKSFIDLFNENSRNVVHKLRSEGGKTFDCHDYMSEATVEILLVSMPKWNTGSKKDPNADIAALEAITNALLREV